MLVSVLKTILLKEYSGEVLTLLHVRRHHTVLLREGKPGDVDALMASIRGVFSSTAMDNLTSPERRTKGPPTCLRTRNKTYDEREPLSYANCRIWVAKSCGCKEFCTLTHVDHTCDCKRDAKSFFTAGGGFKLK